MKIEINTTDKTIKFDRNLKVTEIVEAMKQHLGDDWDSYTVIGNTVIEQVTEKVTILPPYSYKNSDYDKLNVPYCQY